MRKPTALILLALVISTACLAPKGTTANPVLGPGESPTPFPVPSHVGLGKLVRLIEVERPGTASGVPIVTFTEVRQRPTTSVPHEDVPGFVYAQEGPHLLVREDSGRTRTLEEGQAAEVGTDAQHSNPKTAPHVWYFVALRPAIERAGQPRFPDAKIVYASPDLPTPIPGKNYTHILALLTMEAGGRTSAHAHGGAEAFYVLQGSVELRLAGGSRTKVAAGQGAYVKPGTVMQLQVIGGEPVRILTHFVTEEGKPWQDNVETLP